MAASGCFLLLVTLGVVAFVAVVVAIVVARPRVRTPSCGHCGYAVEGLDALRCPECGSDLRQVGILTPRMRRALGPTGWVLLLSVLWSVILFAAMLPLVRVVRSMVPVTSTWTQAASFTSPRSQAYVGLDITITGTGPGALPISDTLEIRLIDPDQASPPTLTIDLPQMTVRPPGPGGTLDAAALRQWLADAGVDVERPGVEAEIGDVVQHVRKAAGGGAVGATTTAFSAVTTRSSVMQSPVPTWIPAVTVGSTILLWLIGIGIITWLVRRRFARR